jgi:hypothetical protein
MEDDKALDLGSRCDQQIGDANGAVLAALDEQTLHLSGAGLGTERQRHGEQPFHDPRAGRSVIG